MKFNGSKYDSDVFICWAEENGYEEGLTIDRIDSNKGYNPENCQFITRSENTSKGNRERKITQYEYNKKVLTLKQHCDSLKLDYQHIAQRINKQGMTLKEAIETPHRWISKRDG